MLFTAKDLRDIEKLIKYDATVGIQFEASRMFVRVDVYNPKTCGAMHEIKNHMRLMDFESLKSEIAHWLNKRLEMEIME